MKKSIKYAGIAAATLLAVAPVVSTTVNAADGTNTQNEPASAQKGSSDAANTNGYASDTTALTNSIAKLNGKFSGNYEATDLAGNKNVAAMKFGVNNKLAFGAFMTSAQAYVLSNSNKDATGKDAVSLDSVYNKNGNTIDSNAVLNDTSVVDSSLADQTKSYHGANVRDMYVTATAKTSNNATQNISDATELTNLLADHTVTNITFTLHYTYTLTNGDDKDATTQVTVSNTDMSQKGLDISFTTPYNVALNETVTSSKLIAGTDFKATDDQGNSVLISDAKPGNQYYTSAKAALKGDQSALATTDAVETSNQSTNSGEVLAPTFKKAGSYYQNIKAYVGKDSSTARYMASVLAHPELNSFTVNGTKFSDINTDNFTYDSSTGMFTFARKIVVSSDASQWTYTHQSGIVTTKDAQNYYTLQDNNNETVGNRALGKSSAWQTDQYRVNNNGVKQYRVATGEWIDADNVTFSDKATTPDNGSALTDIQNQNGTVNLDAPQSFNYLLYTKSGELGNRALSGDSSWNVIQTAKDSKGRTYYRVSTTEWVMEGTGVHFTAK